MNKYMELGIRGAIVASSMVTTTEVLRFYDYKRKNSLAVTIAGNSLGFMIGRRVANDVVKVVKAAIEAYNGEDDD